MRQNGLLGNYGLKLVGHTFCAAHQRLQLAARFVINKKLLRQHGLVAQHVNEKTQGTEIVAEVLEGSCASRLLLINFGVEHFLDAAAHVRHRP